MFATVDPITEVVSKLENVKRSGAGFVARCPAHDDRHASLSVNKGDDGRVLLHCHAGCNVGAILSKIGMNLADIFPQKTNTNGAGKIVAIYTYLDAEGELRYQVVRHSPKDFRQRRPNGKDTNGKNRWIWNMEGVERLLYRLPDLLNAFQEGHDDWIFIAEGEKDVDRLHLENLIATCNVGGAGKWKDEYSETLRGRRCCIIADKDGPGRMHADQVAASLHGKAAEIRVIECPGEGVKDASDFFAAGGNVESLRELVELTPNWVPNSTDGTQEEQASREQVDICPVPLGEIWKSDPHLREPIIEGLVRRGEVANLISASKSYKTYLVLCLAICMAMGRVWLDRFKCRAGKVLVIDMELQKPSITQRTRDIASAMFAQPDDIANMIDVVSLRGRSATIDQVEKILLALPPRTYSAVIIDPLYKTYPEKFDENSNAQMTQLYRRWERMAEHIDGALIIIHHGTKGSQAEKRIVDVGAGASAQSRSADCHIALREHQADDAIVFDARVRSFPPVLPLVLRWKYPLWERDDLLDPANLKSGHKSRNTDKPQPQPKDKPEPMTKEEFIAQFISTGPKAKTVIVARAREAGVPSRDIEGFIALAIDEKRAFEWSFPKKKTVYIATSEQPLTYVEK